MARGFSETMSELRRKKGASQRTAAADLGISQALLSHYENGAGRASITAFRRTICWAGRTSRTATPRRGCTRWQRSFAPLPRSWRARTDSFFEEYPL